MSPNVEAFVRAFVFTQLVETPIYRRFAPTSTTRAFAASAITHPIVWFVFFSERLPLVYEAKTALAETFALVAEAAWLVRCGVSGRRALALSFAANLASVALAAISRSLVGLP